MSTNSEKIKLLKGDITKLDVDAIVNAANSTLLGGGGVDGAIHRAGGKQILEECIEVKDRKGECKTGDAVITSGGKLKARYVIHTVGPVWEGGKNNEEKLLYDCYKSSFKLANEHNVETIAFPCISTGVYGFPKELAANIAVDKVNELLSKYKNIKEVNFVCFDDENYKIYANKLDARMHN